MAKRSAGLLLFRESAAGLEVLLVHPGGPFWAKKDDGAWSIPKGEFKDDEEALTAAKREFQEEMGTLPDGEFIALEPLRQPGGKLVLAWALQADFDTAQLKSNMFSMGIHRSQGANRRPEIDEHWFPIETAAKFEGQAGL
jgi:predicted NUDIX family NTP pyrophosphohydrolase